MNYNSSSIFTKIASICIVCFILTMGLYFTVNRIFLAGIYAIFFLTVIGWPRNLQLTHYHWKIFPVVLFVIYALSCLLQTSNLSEGLRYLDKNIPLLLLPLLWPSSGGQIREMLKRNVVEKLFIIGMIIATVSCLVLAGYNSIDIVEGKIVFDPRVLKDDRIDFYEAINWGGNYFFSNGLSAFIHPSYFSIYLTLGLFLLFQSNLKFYNNRFIGITLCTFFIVFIYLLSSKAGFIALITGALFYLLMRYKKKLLSKKGVIILAAFFGIFILLFVLNPRFHDLPQKLRTQGFELKPDATYSYESRLLTWSSAIGLIKQDPVFGVGVGDVEDELMIYYQKNNYTTPLERRYNVHNQYLETWLATGCLGFIILLAMLAKTFITFIKRDDAIGGLFILIFSIHCLFESMLNKYAGLVFFIFFYSLYNDNLKKLKASSKTLQKKE